MFLVSSCSCLCPIHWSQVLSREWSCSWSSTDRRCSNYVWVINILLPAWVLLILQVLRQLACSLLWAIIYFTSYASGLDLCVSHQIPWVILGKCSANERQRYTVKSTLIGWAHTQNAPWILQGRSQPMREFLSLWVQSLLTRWHDLGCCVFWWSVICITLILLYPPLQRSWKGGILVSPCPSVRLSIRPSIRPFSRNTTPVASFRYSW